MKSVLFGAAVAASLLSGAASATSVQVSYQAPGGVFGTNNLYETVDVRTNGGSTWHGVYAGMYHMTGSNGFGDFLAFCVELNQSLRNDRTYQTSSNLFSNDVFSNIGRLFTTALGGVSMGAAIDTSVKAAGFQVALWEILEDTTGVGGTFDLGSGDFRMDGNASVKSQAEVYLAAIQGPGVSDDEYDLTFFEHNWKQDLVTGSPVPDSPPQVPLPAAGLLLLVGLGGLAGIRRRTRKAS